MHLATIPAPIVAPLIGLAIARKSRYVTAHALQALYETFALNVALGAVMFCSFVDTLTRLWTLYHNDWQGFSLTEFLLRFLIGWLLLTILGGLNAIVSIVQALNANTGRWPRHGRVVRAIHGKMGFTPIE
jgi:hypothetical protein